MLFRSRLSFVTGLSIVTLVIVALRLLHVQLISDYRFTIFHPSKNIAAIPSSRIPVLLTPDVVFGNGKELQQNDSRLLEFIRLHHLLPPSPNPYQLKDPAGDPSSKMGIRSYVHQLLGNKVILQRMQILQMNTVYAAILFSK